MSDSKRALIATALSLGVLWAWSAWFAPRPPQPGLGEQAEAPAAREPSAEPQTPPEPQASPAPQATAKENSPATQDERERVLILESRTAKVKITNVGARVSSWRLLEYLGEEGHDLELVREEWRDHPPGLPLQVVVPGDEARSKRLNEALYVCSEPETVSGGKRIRCTWSDGRGEAIEKSLTLPSAGYVAELEFSASAEAGPTPYLAWTPGLIRDERSGGMGQLSRDVRLALFRKGDIERVTADDAGDWGEEDRTARWAGVDGHYFAAVFAPDDEPARFTLYGREREKGRDQEVGVAWKPVGGGGRARLFVGPKSYDLLGQIDQETGLGVQGLVDYGFFEVIVVGLFWALKKLYVWTGSYGIAIILLTILIKLVFYPITQRSMVSMRRLQKQMKRLQPKIQHIKDRYARKEKKIQNRNEMNQEVMALYRKENVNPMSSMTGCLPLLLQIPILYAFYTLLSYAIELRQTPFLYLSDLSAPEQYAIKTLPLLMGVTMWVQQRLTGTASPDPAQRWMLSAMPLFMTFLFWNFPSGLVLYWLVNNLLGIGQQFLINRQADATEGSPARGRPAVKRA